MAVECRFIEHVLDKYRQRMYNVCMKKRINMYLEEEDRSMVRFLQAKYGLDTESNTIRFLIRKAAKAEGYIETKQERRKE